MWVFEFSILSGAHAGCMYLGGAPEKSSEQHSIGLLLPAYENKHAIFQSKHNQTGIKTDLFTHSLDNRFH